MQTNAPPVKGLADQVTPEEEMEKEKSRKNKRRERTRARNKRMRMGTGEREALEAEAAVLTLLCAACVASLSANRLQRSQTVQAKTRVTSTFTLRAGLMRLKSESAATFVPRTMFGSTCWVLLLLWIRRSSCDVCSARRLCCCRTLL